MKKVMKRSISILLSIMVMACTMLSGELSMYAATPVNLESSTFAVWADPNNALNQELVDAANAGSNKTADLGGIKPFKNSTNSTSLYYLFLPSNADCNNLTFWFPSGKTIKIAGKTIQSGVPTDALKDIDAGGVAKNYTINDGSDHTVVCMKSGNVGSMFVETVSGSMSKVYASSNHSVSEAGRVMVVQPDGTVDYMGDMEKIQGRGNATWGTYNEKNPFNVKLAKSTSLLGMGKAKKWVLLANASDSTLLRNQISYDYSKYIGVKHQPVCKPVDFYVNGQYYGSYQLSEKVEIQSSRIPVVDAYDSLELANGTVDPVTGLVVPKDLSNASDITVSSSGSNSNTTIGGRRYSPNLLNPSDITGGYLYELEISDRWVKENAGFCAYNRQCWVLKNCNYATKDMVDYSYDLLFAMGSSVYNGGVVPSAATTFRYSDATANNPAPNTKYVGMKWDEILDKDSAVRYYFAEEFFKNLDASTTSCYFFKDSDQIDSKVYAGPVWDMDKCWGNSGELNGSRWGADIDSSDGWYAKKVRIYKYSSSGLLSGLTTASSDSQRPLAFLGQLATQKDFWLEVQRLWYKDFSKGVDILAGKAVDEKGQLKSIGEYADTINLSGKMNAARFAGANSSNGNYDSKASTLTNWVTERQTWINKQFTQTNISNGVTVDSIPNQAYTGNAVEPKIHAVGTINGVSFDLVEGVDYELSFSNNINAGTATAILTGKGIYNGNLNETFTISPVDLSATTATIDEFTYKNTELTATLRDENGKKLSSNIVPKYQWYKDGVAVQGATKSIYDVTESDIGSKLYVVISGDDKNTVESTTSNECYVKAGERPKGYTQTLVEWSYDYTNAEKALATGDENGVEYYYYATGGDNAEDARLTASVNAKDNAKIKWSGSADLYENGSVTDQAPVMATSKTDLLAWGQWPYFQFEISTKGFEDIAFSAKLGGTKKGPRDWKLQYSLDGVTFTDVENSAGGRVEYSILNNKTLEQAFENVDLPEECDDKNKVYIRVVASANIAINGLNQIINSTSGDAAINDVAITGSTTGVITKLSAPSFELESGSSVYNDTSISIADTNGGADVYYTIDDGEPTLYNGTFTLFDAATSKLGDTAAVKAWASFGDVESQPVTVVYSFAGVNINSFSYDAFSTDTANGAIQSTSGVYGKSGRMTAYTDGKSQYVPLWRNDKISYCVSPDDGALWSSESGFIYTATTYGYENISFSADGYTTTQGPKSVSLQCSLDGDEWTTVVENAPLAANGVMEKVFSQVALPSEFSHKSKVYFRIVTTEDSTFGGEKLHDNLSKGNLYINNVVISGEDNGKHKQPYTNKATNYFGDSGTIKYISPDGSPIRYAVYNELMEIVAGGTVPAEGLQLSAINDFFPKESVPYTVLTWVGDLNDINHASTNVFYYKGKTIAKFDYTSTKRPIANYLSDDGLKLKSTSGAESWLSMMPNGMTRVGFEYSDSYGVKVAWSEANPFKATRELDVQNGNGFWLIETTTKGYTNVTLNVDQISSNKGPRDWGVAYSTDGIRYTYVENSNTRVISNDASLEPVESYSNLALPAECNDKEKLFIKIFINGGESVDGTELELVTKGNTGINSIELSGVEIPEMTTVSFKVVDQDNEEQAVNGYVSINGEMVEAVDGVVTMDVMEGTEFRYFGAPNEKGTYASAIQSVRVGLNDEYKIAIIPYDVTGDGFINAKDYAKINRESRFDKLRSYLLGGFDNYYNTMQ